MNTASDPPDVDAPTEEEHLLYAFIYFMDAVDTLAAAAETQCEWMGDFNVAWEIKDDASAGKYLLGRGLLSDDEVNVVSALVESLKTVPVDEMPSGAGRKASLEAMSHPSWTPLRALATSALLKLAPRLQEVKSKLGLPSGAA